MAVRRSAVNPWPWSVAMGYNQGEVVEGGSRVLVTSGQAAMSPDGRPQHPGDMAAQMVLTLDNIEAVLTSGGMGWADVVHISTFTTDVDAFFAEYGMLVARLSAAGVAPPPTLVGVSRLANPELLVEIEVTAVA